MASSLKSAGWDGHHIPAYSFADSNSSWQCGSFGSSTQRFQNRGETSALRSISNIATLANLINCSRPHILTASPVSDSPLCKRMKADCAGGHHGPEFSIFQNPLSRMAG
jgi:hypothetical protein